MVQTDEIGSAEAPPPRSSVRGRRVNWLIGLFIAERERWPLWSPVLLGCGIGLYVALRAEPPLWVGAAALLVTIVVAFVSRRRDDVFLLAAALILPALGFTAAQVQSWRAAAPVLAREIGPAEITGRVLELDPLSEGVRVILAPAGIEGMATTDLPARVRIKIRQGGDDILPGDRVRTRAILYPPAPPAMPGAYDFQRRAYFDRLGGIGFAVTPLEILPAAQGEGPGAGAVAIARLRSAMTARILAALPGRAGGIASAIITGETHAIPEEDDRAFRDAGLAHILVIAGLHMGLVAGLAFTGSRAFLALIPWVALRYPTKKWAAAFALFVTFAYMLLSGATVSSRRSFVMTGFVMLAILLDRLQLSARALAYAAAAILILSPMSLTGPSFQMSFAAVGGLIAFYETFGGRLSQWRHQSGPIGRILLHGLGIALTTIICTLATAPYTIFHFNRFALYSVAANLIAVPITGLWVMPWAMISCALMPLGLEALGLRPMGWGIELIADIAHGVTAWPGAVVTLPSMPMPGLLLITAGGLWLAIWRRPWRLAGVLPICIGLATILLVRPPDLIIDAGGRKLALRAADGSYLIAGLRRGLAVETWTRRGAVEIGEAFPKEGASADGSLSCGEGVCRYEGKGHRVALLMPQTRKRTAASFPPGEAPCPEDADLIVALRPVVNCGAGRMIGLADLLRDGTHAIWLDPTPPGMRIETVNGERGRRPWVPQEETPEAALSAKP